jgi:DHA1 family bicyclomycin/chloramphenicol resistance-like MFS transporter
MPAWLVIGLLALLLGLQPVTTDLYLPALPTLKAQLLASMAQSQLTLTALLLAFGCSQLVWGPLSDRCLPQRAGGYLPRWAAPTQSMEA